MSDCCAGSCDEYRRFVDGATTLARSFAAIGLMRKVTESTPYDLVFTYVYRHMRNSAPYWNLSDHAYFNSAKKESKTQLTVWEDNADKLRIPEGLKKMAKDYLIRTFWRNLTTIGSSLEVYRDPKRWVGGVDVPVVRRFPKNVLNVLGTLNINPGLRLWDARSAISDLHAVAVPKGTEYVEPDIKSFDIMRAREIRNVGTLISILSNYSWNEGNRRTIPNEAERNIVLDLLDSLLTLFGCDSYTSSYGKRACYEYTIATGKDGICRNMVGPGGISIPKRIYARYGVNVPAIVARLSRLTPEAALCHPLLSRGNLDSILNNFRYDSLNETVLEQTVPNPIPEVVAFLNAELTLQLMKSEVCKRALRDYNNGKPICGFDESGACDPYAEAICADAPDAHCAGSIGGAVV